MSEIFDHILDSDGDMKLILRNPNTEFAPWPEQHLTEFSGSEKLDDDVQPNLLTENTIDERALPFDDTTRSLSSSEKHHPKQDDIQSHGSDSRVTFLISSRHLKLASERSRRLRSKAWTDKVHSDGLIHIILEDWDHEALLIVLNIIHSRNRNVPHTVSLEMLAKIAVIVDYFKFHEAIEPFTSVWMAGLSKAWPEAYCRDLILRIWISYVFGDDEGLRKLKAAAIINGIGQFADLGFPIPDLILGKRRNYCHMAITGELIVF